MRLVSTRTLVAVLLLSLSAGAPAGVDTDARSLVDLMQVDSAALLGMQLSAQRGLDLGTTTARELKCIEAVKKTEFTEILVGGVTAALTEEETRSAIAFFSTTAGRKYVEQGRAELLRAVGPSVNAPMPEYSEAEWDQVMEFVESPGGHKLVRKRVLQSSEVQDGMRKKIEDLVEHCRGAAVAP